MVIYISDDGAGRVFFVRLMVGKSMLRGRQVLTQETSYVIYAAPEDHPWPFSEWEFRVRIDREAVWGHSAETIGSLIIKFRFIVSVYLSVNYLSIFLSIYLSIYWSVVLSLHLFTTQPKDSTWDTDF